MRSLLLATVALLGGCASLSRNISGDFSCPAAKGVCAPLGAIDARAVASLGTAPSTIGAGDLPTPGSSDARLFSASTGMASPVRAGERTLKVVFPARVDPSGIFREQSVAYAVVERGRWMQGPVASRVATAAASPDELVASLAPRTSQPTSGAPPRAQSSNATIAEVMAFNAGGLSTTPLTVREAVAGLSAAPVAAPALLPSVDAALATSSASAKPTAAALRAARLGHRIQRPVLPVSSDHTRALNAAQLATALQRSPEARRSTLASEDQARSRPDRAFGPAGVGAAADGGGTQ